MSDLAEPIVRFAPSPTGKLHIGNLRTALFNWLFAKKQGGSFVLRLDDTDRERSTDAFAQGIVDDLGWLGIHADMQAKQSDRVASYDKAAQKLKDAGLLYPCYETPDEIDRRRKRLMGRGLPPIYERTGLHQSEEERAAFEAEGRTAHWRFLLPNFEDDPLKPKRTEVQWDDEMRGPQTVDLASMSDPVLIRGDGSYLYTLPSVVDDTDMGITHVIRGGDHITNTGAQIALFKALGATPPAFGHHNLLTDAAGEGLSKRKGALSLASLREDGIEPMALASLATLIGTGQAVEVCASMEDLATLFDPTKVTKSAARFDAHELEGMNEKLLHAMSYENAQPRLSAKGMDASEAFWHAVRPNLARFDQAREWHAVLDGNFTPLPVDPDDSDYLETARDLMPAHPWPDDVWKQWTQALKDKTGRKGRALFMPLRKALTGKEHGPDMAEFLPLIGPEKTALRLS